MGLASWSRRVVSYLSGQGRRYADTLAGLEHLRRLHGGHLAPRRTARVIEREAERRRGRLVPQDSKQIRGER